MTHKERVLNALNHKETDRVPFMYRDVPEVRSRLKRDLNLDTDEELLQYLDIDFRWVEPEYKGKPLLNTAERKIDIWGVEWKYTHFSDCAGYWNEAFHPLVNIHDLDALDNYPWPTVDDWDFSLVEKKCDEYSEYAIMTAPGIASPGIFQYPVQNLIGVERSFTEPLMNPEFFQKLIDKIVTFHVAFIDKFFASAKGKIDFFRIGDDFGTQQGLQIDIDTWETFFMPAFKNMADTAKKYGAHYYQHSCGAIRDLIPSFLAAGVEVLDPVQVKADGMIPSELKTLYGERLTFSGGIDEQDLLPNGTTEMIKKEVAKMIGIMGANGGYFLGPTHNFQADIPTKNIIAMYEAGNEKLHQYD
jgi:uroporphyrinogen decarboxylase